MHSGYRQFTNCHDCLQHTDEDINLCIVEIQDAENH